MNEERAMILEMLKNGKITMEEADSLLDALPAGSGTAAPDEGETGEAGRVPTRMRVEITRNGSKAVNVRLPLSLVRTGLKIGKVFGKTGGKMEPEQAAAMDALKDMDIDEVMEAFRCAGEKLPYTIIDVDGEDGEHVTVMLE